MFMILLFNLHCAKKTEALLGTGPFVHKLFKYILYKGLCVLFAFVSEKEKNVDKHFPHSEESQCSFCYKLQSFFFPGKQIILGKTSK